MTVAGRSSSVHLTYPGSVAIRRLWIAFIFFAVATGPAVADSDTQAKQWLERMTEASRRLNYDATFVYRSGDSMQSMRIIHRSEDQGGELERLVSLTGEAREVIRDPQRVTCILPNDRSVVVSKSRPRGVGPLGSFAGHQRFAPFYRLSSDAGERVAGRSTMMVKLEPKDGYRYGYRLFVDKSSALLLKSELLADNGRVLEQIIYTTLELPENIPDRMLKPGHSGEGFTWYTSTPQSVTDDPNEPAWVPTWVPDGFAMSDRVRDRGDSHEAIEHLVYSDGLASVSVFVERVDQASGRLEGLSTMGAVNAFGKVIEEFQITVVGEVPAKTVVQIGKSITHTE